MTISAHVALDSIHSKSESPRITTMILRFPRFILPELNTHRVFCISGDAVIDFEMPSAKERGHRRVHSMTIREFYDKWVNGAAEGKVPSFKGGSLESLDDYALYSAREVAAILGFAHASNLNNHCRQGRVVGAFKSEGWMASGKAWKDWRSTMGLRRFSLRSRLEKMNIRQLNEKTGEVTTSNVREVVFSGVKKVYRIEAGKYSVSATADHRILTTEGWKRLGDIKVGVDRIVTYGYGTNDQADINRFNKIDGKWVQTWSRQNRHVVAARQNNCCAVTGDKLEMSFHLHHVKPRHQFPELAFDIDNVIAVNANAHRELHGKQGWQVGVPLISSDALVESITDEGETDTYDLEIAGEFANFFADGIVVHNSRNASSSRAVPVRKIIEDVQTDPAMPVEWGTHKPGMQAGAPLSDDEAFVARQLWLDARDQAVDIAQSLLNLNLSKQVVNRILEPYSHTSVIVTATEWQNFFDLRCHPDADPTMRALAETMQDAMDASVPVERIFHIPLVPDFEARQDQEPLRKLMFISAARCARVSYLNHDQSEPDEQRDLELAGRLAKSRHLSVFEHQAVAMEGKSKGNRNFVGWYQHRALVEGD